ncbi:MAG: hypothetical protein EOP45_17495 [Sphingobacteriaceae bacterium]|nr:MAG: hypothetical protein EOP45_17495 [Sphingobacteriaceae bacterium]
MIDVLFDHPFTFELSDDDVTKSFADLQQKHSDIPESILLCEYERLHYKFHIPLESEVQHAQNSEGWKHLRTKFLTSSSIGDCILLTPILID